MVGFAPKEAADHELHLQNISLTSETLGSFLYVEFPSKLLTPSDTLLGLLGTLLEQIENRKVFKLFKQALRRTLEALMDW